jgi:hypothetical protein
VSKYEIALSFEAYLSVEGESESEAFEKAIEKARADYGSEVADFGEFRLINKEERENNAQV